MVKLFLQPRQLLQKTQLTQRHLLLKDTIREEISCLTIDNRSSRDKNLIEHLSRLNHKIILSFIPIKLEPDIIQFLVNKHKSGVIVGLPSVVGNEIIFKVYNDKFRIGKFGILEPDTDQLVDISQSSILAITPLIACTVDGKRLGRGGGYYDRFFTKHQHIFKVGVCYKEQVLEYIPTESHDIKLDRIIYC